MLLPGTVSVLGVVVALGAPGPAPAPSSRVDVVPVLTSTPFGAGPGQQVRHLITLSGTGAGTVAAVRVTYTTTVDLTGAAAKASPGRCAVSARTVVCDLGDLRFAADATKPTIMITGTIGPGAAPGTLVQNRVSVDSPQFATKSANQVASNAYLVSGSSAAPASRSTAVAHSAVAPAQSPWRSGPATVIATLLVCAAVALGGLVVLRRRRQRRLVTTPSGQPEHGKDPDQG